MVPQHMLIVVLEASEAEDGAGVDVESAVFGGEIAYDGGGRDGDLRSERPS